ncbi:unnamed protein product [Paramecium primaurelia]|uniref:VPS9 domain-containing protein n=1 Tax=Paramecium primaurelia TaxID=5886 RepID=A0A8S1N840_PARPR|nr:unnamed protein product [Paramecium primaurelia]
MNIYQQNQSALKTAFILQAILTEQKIIFLKQSLNKAQRDLNELRFQQNHLQSKGEDLISNHQKNQRKLLKQVDELQQLITKLNLKQDQINQLQLSNMIFGMIKLKDSRFNPFHLNSLSVAMIYKYLQDKIEIPEQITMKQISNLIEKEHDNIKKEPLLIKQQQVSQFHIFTIERFIFNKIFDQMMNYYIEKYQERQNQVDLKKKQLKEKYSKEDLIKSLEIKNQYLPNSDIPYFEAINELKLINLYKTPTEMLKQFQYVLVLIRGVAFECNQKEEIIAMDDELPILIWVALISDVPNLYAKIQFVDDYIQEIENEKRILTNLRVSLDYISKEWKL